MEKAILCFIRRDNNEVLMIYDEYPHGAVWNGISGSIDNGETAQKAVVREVKEEVGIDVQESDLKYLGTYESFAIFEEPTYFTFSHPNTSKPRTFLQSTR